MSLTMDGSIPDTDLWSLIPPTIEINGYKVPAPEVVAPAEGTKYLMPNLWAFSKTGRYTWHGNETDNRALARGLVHLTEAAALKHAEALLFFTTKE